MTALRNILDTLRKRRDARKTRKVLHALSDRELNDIGLCRGDIDFIA